MASVSSVVFSVLWVPRFYYDLKFPAKVSWGLSEGAARISCKTFFPPNIGKITRIFRFL